MKTIEEIRARIKAKEELVEYLRDEVATVSECARGNIQNQIDRILHEVANLKWVLDK